MLRDAVEVLDGRLRVFFFEIKELDVTEMSTNEIDFPTTFQRHKTKTKIQKW
jgi:hypothetical protein